MSASGNEEGADQPAPASLGYNRRSMQTQELPKRFYRDVSTSSEAGGAFGIRLDSRLARTPGKQLLLAPSQAIADHLAVEWNAQSTHIDPSTMPFTRLVVTSIDGVAGRETAVAADMLNYAGSDLLCYRAASPPGHAALQAERWDPVLEWARVQHQLRFVVAEGVIPVAQPDITLQRMAALLGDVSALPLTALHTITTLTGSAILMLALYKQAITAEAAWSAACVDEEWQASQWGVVEEAATQRARRQREFAAASTLLCLCHSSALDAPW